MLKTFFLKSVLLHVVIISVMGSTYSQAQGSDFVFYRANGERIPVEKPISLNGFVATYFDSLTRYYNWRASSEDKRLALETGILSICFKSLTPTPFGIMSTQRLSKTVIDSVLRRFTPASYFQTKRFYDDLRNLIDDKKLTSNYVIETLGSNFRRVEETDSEYEHWIYDKLKLTLFLQDTLVIDFDSKNYSGNIETRISKVDNYKSFSVPSDKYYYLTKVIKSGKTHYFIEFYSTNEIYSVSSPLKILLKNGTKITSSEEANRTDDDSETKAFARFYLTPQEALLLSGSVVMDVMLGDAHQVIPTENAERLMGYIKALLPKK